MIFGGRNISPYVSASCLFMNAAPNTMRSLVHVLPT